MKQLNNKELAVVIVTCVAIVGAFAYGRGVFGNRNESTSVSETSTPASASTSSTTPQLERRSYDPGQCVTWDQSKSALGDRITSVVPCNEEHLFEYIATASLDWSAADYPDEAAFNTARDEKCADPVRKYLGYDLDPAGRFYVATLRPTKEGWATGDRVMACGLGESSLVVTDTSLMVPFSGPVKGAEQDLLYPVGTCTIATPDKSDAIDCAQAWTHLVTGNVELTGRALPQNDAEWNQRVGDKCAAVGKANRPDLYQRNRVGWFPIEQSSWDAGRRTVQCSLSPA